MGLSPIRLPVREWRRLRRRAYAAQQIDVSEICGLFAVRANRQIFLVFVANESDRDGHFEFSWQQFWLARKQIRRLHGRYIGIFHSHPIATAAPGPMDIRKSRINSYQIIYDVCGTTARLWRVVKRGGKKAAAEIPLLIERTSGVWSLSGPEQARQLETPNCPWF